jgi:hypothetical protein
VRNGKADVCSLAAALILAGNGKDTTDSHAGHAILHSGKGLLEKKSYEYSVDYNVLYKSQLPHPAYYVFYGQHEHAKLKCVLSDYDAPFQTQSVRLSPILI